MKSLTMRLSFIFCILFSLLLASCASSVKSLNERIENPLHATNNPKFAVKRLWKTTTFVRQGTNVTTPMVDHSSIFITGGKQIAAYNKNNGQLRWKSNLKEVITTNPSRNGKLVIVGTANGHIIGLSAKTGKTVWIADVESEVYSLSAANVKALIAKTLEGKLYAIIPQSGMIAWSRGHKSPLFAMNGSGRPLIIGTTVVAGFDNGQVVAYEVNTGKRLWKTQLSGPTILNGVERLVDVDAELFAFPPVALYASSLYGKTVGLSLKTGKVGWKNSIASRTGFAGANKTLFVTDIADILYKLNAETGESIWINRNFKYRHLTTPLLLKTGAIVVADKQGYIHWIDSVNGKYIARIKGSNAPYLSDIVVSGEQIYALSSNGELSSYGIQ